MADGWDVGGRNGPVRVHDMSVAVEHEGAAALQAPFPGDLPARSQRIRLAGEKAAYPPIEKRLSSAAFSDPDGGVHDSCWC